MIAEFIMQMEHMNGAVDGITRLTIIRLANITLNKRCVAASNASFIHPMALVLHTIF
ncbi:protein of unknown function [Paenibacillus alvei]|uniref:Uncharacterized protein n=1 Tax=Paenibacillus alvei TaxID=44250 RepID=A0A383RKF9_PAEAL|nr:protein of unknown function [Paenibacillus alvei]